VYSQLHFELLGGGFELLGGGFELLGSGESCFAADRSFVMQLGHSMLNGETLNFPGFLS
jgi:hypothetical protein